MRPYGQGKYKKVKQRGKGPQAESSQERKYWFSSDMFIW